MVKVTFAGTNGWYDSVTGSTVCTVVEYPGFNVILDAGSGFAKLDRFIDFDRPSYLFLSHLHVDHISGLHTLPRYVFRKGLSILLSEKVTESFDTFMNAPYTAPVSTIMEQLHYEIRVVRLPGEAAELPFLLKTLPVVHSAHTIAARFEYDGITIAYVTDTGFCDNAVRLAEDADLLIVECAHRSGEKHPEWPHLTPEDGAEIGRLAGCRAVILTHFDAHRYPSDESRQCAEQEARKVFNNTQAAYDGFVYYLSGLSPSPG